ncbi:MAG TPA: TCR/Tet family MFS transporter [Magnetospirillaceae bacterium]|jgi:DHA1 family tetracycline resistance protein-like MFS transporter
MDTLPPEPFEPPTAPSPTLTGPRRAAVVFVFITVTLDMLALGIMIPMLPKLILSFVGDTASAAHVFGLFSTCWALMQFLFSPALGALSDRFGRRPIILVSNFGLGIDYIIMALAPTVGWLLVGRIVSGIAAASITTSSAYIADVTPPEKRAKAFGLIGAAFGVGFVLGPAVGGVLGEIGPRLPFWVAAGLSLLNGTYGLFVLPESLAQKYRVPVTWRRANPLGALSMLRGHRGLVGLSAVVFLSQFAHVVLPSVVVLYAGYRYEWDARDVGLMLAGVGLCTMIVQGGLAGPVTKALGERRTLLFAIVCGAAAFAVFGLASTGWAFLIGIPIMAFWGLAGPACQSLMTRQVGPSEQGRLQGSNNSLNGIANMIAPSVFTGVFVQFIGPWQSIGVPGAPFLVSLVFLLLAALVGVFATRRSAVDGQAAL